MECRHNPLPRRSWLLDIHTNTFFKSAAVTRGGFCLIPLVRTNHHRTGIHIAVTPLPPESASDLFIIGGGINGCGIARDAAGRGLSVRLAEMGDLGSATSSASTKLFHGGLRYLEHLEFRLVREALVEREILLRAMPHISWPMRFVLPHDGGRRGQRKSLLPWRNATRPAWMIRAGLFLYDTLGGRKILPGTRTLDLATAPEGEPLQDRFRTGFEYSDCWVDDARLVVLNARDAAGHGADILVRTKVLRTRRCNGWWEVQAEDLQTGQTCIYRAHALVNATGPWVAETLHDTLGLASRSSVRLVRGSHIVTRKLFDHDRSYILLGDDRRVVFAIPYETEFTLIGTTDVDHGGSNVTPHCTDAERDYLIDVINRHFRNAITQADVVWSYSGIRPLHDDGTNDASSVTRDYSFDLDATDDLPALSVFGGKITTYRRLAENAVNRLASHFPQMSGIWTAHAPLPGGDFPHNGVPDLINTLKKTYPFLDTAWAQRLARSYGTEATQVLGQARTIDELGMRFTGTLTATEVKWLIDREYARTSDDILWRRSKLGLHATPDEFTMLDHYIGSVSEPVQSEDVPPQTA